MSVEFGAAAFGFCTPSLGKLLLHEWCLDKIVKVGLTSLQADVRSMQPFLQNVSCLRPDLQLDPQAKQQSDDVSDLSHAMEARLHSFVVRIEDCKESTTHALLPAKISEWGINHEINSYIKDAQIKIKELRKQYGLYPCKSSLESTSTKDVDPRILAMYTMGSTPIGIEGAIDELTKKLSNCNHVSIVGMGGTGKTTLARAFYDKMRAGYGCCAFITIGHSAEPEKVLEDMFYELHTEIPRKERGQLKAANQLQNFLKGNRCLLVIDDIWDKKIWNLVERVSQDMAAGSKIITTSRNSKVAEGVDGGNIYNIQPLSPADSKELLRTKIFGAEAEIHHTGFDNLLDKFLRKSGGVPMAIVVIGSFLAKYQTSEWQRVYDSIHFDEHEVGGALDKVMQYSYIDLPSHLKKCFLYLSLFPEGHWIEKNMLIWKWVAEGLVSDGLFETGETYFNELIDRCMIQWAVNPRDIGLGGCRVHRLMFCLIRVLSSSENQNFSTVLDKKHEGTSQTRPIHRLAMHEIVVGQNQNTSLEVGQVLSFYANTCSGSSFPALSASSDLRVIELEGCDLTVGECTLEHLGSKGLEYVGLLATPVAKLPENIGRLMFLQTLDVRETGISELPSFIENLRKLRCMRAGKSTRMMGRVGKLTSLEELWLHSADKSPDFAVDLRKLTKLRVLVIHLDKMDEDLQKVLVESLQYLKMLQVMQIWFNPNGKVRLGGWEDSVPNPELRQLLLFGVILPKETLWIHHLSVPKLSKLLLQVETLTKQHLEILGQMQSLRSLYLHSEDGNLLSYIAHKEEFQELEYVNTNIELICGEGGLPKIHELEVGGIRVGMDVGLRENMLLLERATYHLDCMGCSNEEVQKAEEELQRASRDHPKHPTLCIKRWNNFGTEMHYQITESLSTDTVRTALSSTGGSPGLSGGGQGNVEALSFLLGNPAFVNAMADAIARILPALGAPHTLAVSDATDSTSSQSQEPSRNSEGETVFSTGGSSAYLNSQFPNNEFGKILAAETGTDPALLMNMMENFSRNPEIAASMDDVLQNADGSLPSGSDLRGVVVQMIPDIISHLHENVGTFDISRMNWPMVSAVMQILDGLAAGTQEGNNVMADNEASATDAAGMKNTMERFLQNPESASNFSSLANVMMSEVFRRLAKKLDELAKGQGADADAILAGNDGAGPSGPPPASIKLDADGVLSWLNSPYGATFLSEGATRFGMGRVSFERMCKKCMLNPEMIASVNRGGFSSFLSAALHMTQHVMPAMMKCFFDQMKPSSTPQYANGGPANASSTRAPPPESGQEDVENRMAKIIASINSALQNVDISGIERHSSPSSTPQYANSGGRADTVSGMISSLLDNPAIDTMIANLSAQPGFMDAIAAGWVQGMGAPPPPESSGQDGEKVSRMLRQVLPAVQQELATRASSGQPSSAQVNADSVLSHGGGPGDASGMLSSGLSSDPALAAPSDMMDASLAPSRQDGEDTSTTFNFNELIATLEKASAAGQSSGEPSSAQPDNVGHEDGGGT